MSLGERRRSEWWCDRISGGQITALAMAIILTTFTISTPSTAADLQEPAPKKISIEIIEGEDGINNIRLRTAREPIVEVTDENHKPVAGALVLFTLPSKGASGAFVNGSQTLSVTTNAQGRAAAQGLKPNSNKGKFKIQVDASANGLNAQTFIQQTNIRPFFISTKVLVIGSIVLAGLIVGIILATRGGSTPTVITPGSPTIGGR